MAKINDERKVREMKLKGRVKAPGKAVSLLASWNSKTARKIAYLRTVEEPTFTPAILSTQFSVQELSTVDSSCRFSSHKYYSDLHSVSCKNIEFGRKTISRVPIHRISFSGNIWCMHGGSGRFRVSSCDLASIVAFRDESGVGIRGWGGVKDARPRERLGFQGRPLRCNLRRNSSPQREPDRLFFYLITPNITSGDRLFDGNRVTRIMTMCIPNWSCPWV